MSRFSDGAGANITMRQFDYSRIPEGLITKETMDLLAAVHEHKGRQELHLSVRADILDALVDVAKVQSTEASNRIEGIRTSEKRLKAIMDNKTDLTSRDEEEIAGYRDVLTLIHENYKHMKITPNVLLQLHRDLYRYTPSAIGGHFKNVDNEIRGIRRDGTDYVRFKPVSAAVTPQVMDQLCKAFERAIETESMDPLLLSLLFVFDFTCVHPFNDGNGRMSRLLTLLLLYRSGYDVGKYISIEKEIERTKGSYYEALEQSSSGWDENKNDPGPFVRYMLRIILASYRDFEDRVSLVSQAKASKSERVESFVSSQIGKVRKSDIKQALPDISETTIERTLAELLKAGKLEKISGGRGAAYIWIG